MGVAGLQREGVAGEVRHKQGPFHSTDVSKFSLFCVSSSVLRVGDKNVL